MAEENPHTIWSPVAHRTHMSTHQNFTIGPPEWSLRTYVAHNKILIMCPLCPCWCQMSCDTHSPNRGGVEEVNALASLPQSVLAVRIRGLRRGVGMWGRGGGARGAANATLGGHRGSAINSFPPGQADGAAGWRVLPTHVPLSLTCMSSRHHSSCWVEPI